METPLFLLKKDVEITQHQARTVSLIMHDKGIDYVADVLGCSTNAVQNSMASVRLKLNTNTCLGIAVYGVLSGFDLKGNYNGFYLFEGFVPHKAFPWPTPTS